VAAGRPGLDRLRDDPLGLVGVVQAVQHGREEQRDRLAEVDPSSRSA
jgi:hypothetical protein